MTPEERREYDRERARNPEIAERHRRAKREWAARNRAANAKLKRTPFTPEERLERDRRRKQMAHSTLEGRAKKQATARRYREKRKTDPIRLERERARNRRRHARDNAKRVERQGLRSLQAANADTSMGARAFALSLDNSQ